MRNPKSERAVGAPILIGFTASPGIDTVSRLKTSAPARRRLLFCLLPVAFSLGAWAQTFSIPWSTVDGGGGTSTGGVYAVSGTIGQPDAGRMSGGQFTLEGGFWGVIAVIQTPGAPYLSVTRSNATVVVSWAKADSDWKLECTPSLITAGTNIWTLVPSPYPTNATDCVVTEPAPLGYKFYRLRKP